MKTFSLLVVNLLLLSGAVCAQDNYNFIRLKLGYGSYNMSDLERIQNLLIDIYSQQQIPVTAVDKFPPYWNYQVEFLRKLNDSFGLSGFFGYASTGGRIHYSDYSGEIKSDQTVTANLYGIGVEYYFNPLESLRFFSSVNFSLIFSSLELNDFFRIYNESTGSITKFNSFGIGIEPSVGIEYEISSLLFRFDLGLLLNGQGAFYFEEQPDVALKINGDEISPDWMGYRFGFSVGFVFCFCYLHSYCIPARLLPILKESTIKTHILLRLLLTTLIIFPRESI